ncbi:hypothetical protein VNO77_02152 [Canavalia gladiata]|uniref:Uncharacterized protein n=1 Tax=Canavalia gladiata TaxID=3824 RepID=A0AAN9R5U2_CANGL
MGAGFYLYISSGFFGNFDTIGSKVLWLFGGVRRFEKLTLVFWSMVFSFLQFGEICAVLVKWWLSVAVHWLMGFQPFIFSG